MSLASVVFLGTGEAAGVQLPASSVDESDGARTTRLEARATGTEVEARSQLARLRIPFIANQGQVDARVAYYAPTFAGTLFITRGGELVYSLAGPNSGASPATRGASRSGWNLTETLRGGKPRPSGTDRSATKVSGFFGNDPARWRSQVPTYDQVGLGEVWPGVTVSLQARGRSIEKVFTVAPGASVGLIRIRVGGAGALSVGSEGQLVMDTGMGAVTFTAPVAYQERDGVRRSVEVAYRLMGREYRFSVGAYDPALPLVIDPLLQSTYLGGSGDDQANAVAIHPNSGDVYVAGSAFSTNFPGTIGGAQPMSGSSEDVFVARLNSSLTALTQATYLGGTDGESALALAIHPSTGDVYVTGYTSSTNFPGTAGGAQTTFGDGPSDAFIARFPSSLTSLAQATYLGGSGQDYATRLVINPTTGDVYVAGVTASINLPGTIGGAQAVFGGGTSDAFVARLPSSLTALTKATYLGGSSYDQAGAIAINPTTGDVYIAGVTASTDFPGTAGGAQPAYGEGQDAFVARLTGDLTSLTKATYLGGSDTEGASALEIHPPTGDVYAAGFTGSNDFPGTNGGAQQNLSASSSDAFIARFSASLTSLIQSTYLGGSGDDSALALAIHPATVDVYVAGSTSSSNFPGTAGGPSFGGGNDAFVARLPSVLTSLTQSTYLGGSGDDSALDVAIHLSTGDVYVAGNTSSTNFPATIGGAQATSGGNLDAFVTRLTLGTAPGFPILSVFPSSRNFGAIAINTTTDLTFTVQNTGGGTLTGTAAAGAPFGVVAGGSFSLAAGASQAVTVRFSPTSVNTFNGNVDFTTSNAGNLSRSVSGQGVVAVLSVTPSSVNFGPIGVNTTADLTFTVQNTGGGTLTGTAAAAGAPFSVVAGSSFSLGSGASQTVTVRFSPTSAATFSRNVDFASNGGTLSPSVIGQGVVPVLTVTPTSLNFGTIAANTTADLTFTVQNTGGGTLTGTAAAGGAPFSVVSGSPFSLGAGASQTVTVRFSPTSAGTSNSSVNFTSNGGNLARSVTGDGAIPGGQVLSVTPASLNFGTIMVNTMAELTFNVQNTGIGTLTGTAAAAAPFSVVGGSPFSLGAGASQTVTVRFNPTWGGPFSSNVDFTSNGGNLSRPVTAKGQTFADVPVGHAFWTWIEALARTGITSGCATNPLQYCPDPGVTRAQMAVFLLRGMAYPNPANPPGPTGALFADVPLSYPLVSWVEGLFGAGITSGCATSPLRYCPDDSVTRAQMAVFLLRAKHGAGYQPPVPTQQTFADVPLSDPFAKWIYQLAAEGITGGCSTSPAQYCPDASVTRAQMAVFLTRAFGLPI